MAKPTSSNSKPRPASRKKAKSDEGATEQAQSSTSEIVEVEAIKAMPVEDVPVISDAEIVVENKSQVDVEAKSTDTPAQVEADSLTSQDQKNPKKTKSSFVPLVLGGAIAGAIGFGAAVLFPNLYSTKADAVPMVAVGDFEALQARVDALPKVLSQEEVAAIFYQELEVIAEQVSGIERRIEEVSSRLDLALETPAEAGALSPAALAEYQQEIVSLRAELDAQQTSLSQMVSQASSQLEAAQVQSQQFEASAAEVARSATLSLALAKVQTAIETGAPYQAVLSEFSAALGNEVPEAIAQNAGEGVSTQAALVADFDIAADSALAVARAEGVDGEERTAFGAFLRSQFDVRSVTPQEGTSVDAILSRAQAALNDARLVDALAEVRSLPEVARAEMVDWISRAEARAAVVAAVDELSFSLNDK